MGTRSLFVLMRHNMGSLREHASAARLSFAGPWPATV